MEEGSQWLEGIASRMKKDIDSGAAASPQSVKVRDLLRKFSYERRGDWINNHIRNELEKFKLRTDQDFTVAWLDSIIDIELDSDAPGAPRLTLTSDPTLRISALEAANRKPASVKPDNSLKEATTKMQVNGYSRLPVMKTDRDVSGIVTWESIGTRLSLGVECSFVRECMEPAEVISGDTRLFVAIRRIAEHGYALVRARDRTITGIVTATDLSYQFGQLAEPFLRLKLDIDRKIFVKYLNSVREIRNSVMHFNPDGLHDDQRRTIKNVARFFDQLAHINVAP